MYIYDVMVILNYSDTLNPAIRMFSLSVVTKFSTMISLTACEFKEDQAKITPILTALSPRLKSGYSRIPVHEPGRPSAFVGLLLIKKVPFSPFKLPDLF